MSSTVCVSPSAAQRLEHATDFLRALPASGPLLMLVPSPAAGTLLMARVLAPLAGAPQIRGEARFAWRRRTLDALARELSLPELARTGRVPLRSLASEALVTRVVRELDGAGGLGTYAPLSERPGFVRALARTLDELRLAAIASEQLAQHAPELARVLAGYEAALSALGLADRAHILEAARSALERGPPGEAELPLLALDVPLAHHAEAMFAYALAERAGAACVTVARGDERSEAHWRIALGLAKVVRREPGEGSELGRLQARLFASALPVEPGAPRDGGVRIVSSPGEAREAVEVARAILREAERGVPFDRMAIVLRAVEGYRGVVEEALTRAAIPAHYADGVRRPRSDGRAFLALLGCARDGLSARGFAEYLSIGAMQAPAQGACDASLSTPRKWERMLVDAAVIGGRERWERRLRGLSRELADASLALEPDDPRRADVARDIEQLAALERFALPLLDLLAELPDGGTWGAWLSALDALARHALAEPDVVCELLTELSPLAPVGPVSLHDVVRVLAPRLTSVIVPSAGTGAGKVFVGAIDDVRGRAFDVVFVMGLAERVFPARIGEDALLPDATRRRLGPELWVTEERVARERLLLRVAVGAASERLVLTFPRFDVAHGRPRVPSFYGLEVLQAIEGSLPAFDELTRRAHPGAAARMGFPAPENSDEAIDDAEYDLSQLARLTRARPEEKRGAARYLLASNVHLARALRFRARRWELSRFSPADGYVASTEPGRALLARERLGERAYSATALAQFALCPYRFYLHAIAGVAERPEALASDELDARQRGVLFHRIQRALLSALRAEDMLPIGARLPAARGALARVFEAEAQRAHDDYAPSLEGAFEAGLATLRHDLDEWLERLALDARYVPRNFELGFGVAEPDLDPASVREPLALAVGVRLAGAIDLVERDAEAPEAALVLRATDHKTSPAPDKLGVTAGGRVLQPLLYALALEQLFPKARVSSGRLYFCTSRGGFVSHEVPLDGTARAVAKELLTSIDAMIAQGFLPAAPALQPDARDKRSECERCAYRVICGPHEPERVAAVKARELSRLAPLFHVRGLP